jgi:hypothetical protein
LIIHYYTPRFIEHEGRCVSCSHAKFYLDGKDGRRERNGRGKTGIKKIKVKGEEISYKEIIDIAASLDFLYL